MLLNSQNSSSSVICANITAISGSRLKNTKYCYVNACIKVIRKHFTSVTCATIQSRSLFNFINTRKAAKWIQNKINAVDQG